MIELILMIVGDCFLVILMGYYAGVGIRESSTTLHVTMMLLPSILVWLLCAFVFKAFPSVEEIRHIPSGIEGRKSLLAKSNYIFYRAVEVQHLKRLFWVWLISCLFAICWQTFYWGEVLHSSFRSGLTKNLFIWYGSTNFLFFALWRIGWTFIVWMNRMAARFLLYRIVAWIFCIASIVILIPGMLLQFRYASRKFSVETLPPNAPRTALVFGAGVYMNGRPSAVLVDRVQTAVDLYHAGKVDELILSGSNNAESRWEVDVMAQLAVEAGVPDSALIHDNEGYSTVETVVNAKILYGRDSAIVVSQAFHLNRILMMCEHYGLDAVSVFADQSVYNVFSKMSWYIRDWMGATGLFIHYLFGKA